MGEKGVWVYERGKKMEMGGERSEGGEVEGWEVGE